MVKLGTTSSEVQPSGQRPRRGPFSIRWVPAVLLAVGLHRLPGATALASIWAHADVRAGVGAAAVGRTIINAASEKARDEHEALDEDDGMVDKIVFIKTHSTGSSTFASILHRFCDAHGRRCFVHPPGTPPGKTTSSAELSEYVEEEDNEKTAMFRQLRNANASNASLRRIDSNVTAKELLDILNAGETWRPLDIWPNHVVLDSQLFDRLIPGNVKISLFREPLDRLLSSFSHGPELPLNTSRAEEVRGILADLRAGTRPRPWCGHAGTLMTANVPLREFDKLDIVLLTDQFDLSLILMRRRLKWRVRDIAYLKLKDHHEDPDLETAREQMRSYLTFDGQSGAARQLKKNCLEGDEATIYDLARKKFDADRTRLSTAELADVAGELASFGKSLDSLGQCCEEAVDDPYCKQLTEDNVPWVVRHRPFSLRGAYEQDCSSRVQEWDSVL